MSESEVMQKIRSALSVGRVRLFRQNVGRAWRGTGEVWRGKLLTITNPRPVEAGLCKGSSDLIGWTQVTITPDMVGKTLAVFTAIEVKHGGNSASPEQENFIRVVNSAGGIAGVAYSVEQARDIIENGI